jgi:hypothetical protein
MMARVSTATYQKRIRPRIPQSTLRELAPRPSVIVAIVVVVAIVAIVVVVASRGRERGRGRLRTTRRTASRLVGFALARVIIIMTVA